MGEFSFVEKVKIFFLLFFFSPFFLFRRRSKVLNPESILLIRLDRFGDMVLTLPLLRSVRAAYPHAELSVLCSPCGADLLEAQDKASNGKFLKEIIVWHDVWDMHGGKKLGLTDLLLLLKQVLIVRRRCYDVIIQPSPLGIWTFFALFLRSKTIIATISNDLLFSKSLIFFVDIPIKEVGNFFEQNIKCAFALGVDAIENNGLSVDLSRVSSYLHSIDVKNCIIINISAGDSIRILPLDVTIKFVNRLLSRYEKKHILLIGSKGDKKLSHEICSFLVRHVYNMVGTTTVDDLIYILERSLLLVTPDTGTMHLAAMLDIYIVAYFSAGSLERFSPVTDDCTIIHHDLGCSGCRDMCFTDEMPKPCMAAITVDELFDAVSSVLDKRGENVED